MWLPYHRLRRLPIRETAKRIVARVSSIWRGTEGLISDISFLQRRHQFKKQAASFRAESLCVAEGHG